MNLELNENVQNYNRENKIKFKYFGRNMTKNDKIRFHNIFSSPVLLYDTKM